MFDLFPVTTLLLSILLITNSSCKDPEEYDPQEPKLPPPNPPALMLPLYDTVICEGPVLFDWAVPSGSEIFQIQADTLSSYSTAEIFLVDLPTAYIPLPYYHGRTTYWARIRAGSSGWTNYTAWSETRRFFLWPEW
jgi:hypothetical protein